MNTCPAQRAFPRAALAGLAVALAGCSTPPPAPLSALPVSPKHFRADATPGPAHTSSSTAASETVAAQPGWTVFGDPTLDALIARAEAAHPGLEAAAARVAQVRAQLRSTESSAAPQLTLQAAANRQGGPLVNAAGSSGTLLSATLGAAYELDLFGRLAQGRQAAALDLQSQTAWAQATRLLVQAEVAQTYFALRATDAELTAAHAAVQAWQDSLRLTEGRWRAGSVPELAVHRLRAELAGSQAEAAALQGRRAELQHALAALVGEAASSFELPAAAAAAPTEITDAAQRSSGIGASALPVPPTVPAGLPSAMLARRPDVVAAQHTWAAALARSGVARSAWLPSLTLTASGGQASDGLADLLRGASRAWGLGVLTALPLLDGGRREASVLQADAQVQLDWAQYRGQILQAYKDVEDQLVALRSLREQAAWQMQAAEAAARARTLAEGRVRSGLGSQLELLDAQRTALRSQRAVLQLRAAQLRSTVGLIKALGGSWDDTRAPA